VGEKKKRVGRVNGKSVEVIVMPPIIIRISGFVAIMAPPPSTLQQGGVGEPLKLKFMVCVPLTYNPIFLF